MASKKRVVWRPLIVGGKLSGEIKSDTEDASGAYAVRTKRGHGVVYVGESHVGRMWRTILRHFQAPDTFRSVGRSSFATSRPEDYEIAIRVTSRGKRTKAQSDERAMAEQAAWIEEFRKRGHKLHNVDDGLAEVDPWDEPTHAPEPEHAFADLLNPGRPPRRRTPPLTELGRLTHLSLKPGREVVDLHWGLRSAPILAYDDAGKLHVVYAGAVVRPSTDAERKKYARTHWGAAGRGDVRSGGVAPPPLVSMGPAIVITYTTRKGEDSELVDYVHPFGDGAKGSWAPPHVVTHMCRGGCAADCAARGAIGLRGGTYHVDTRGIVG